MKIETLINVSVGTFSLGCVAFFVFILGFSFTQSGFGAFGLLGSIGLALIGCGFVTQFMALRWLKTRMETRPVKE